MSDIKSKYPAANADTVDITITLASLATSSSLTGGAEGGEVDNTTTLDLDHILVGKVTTGTTPTANKMLALYVAVPIDISAGARTYPDVLDGTASAETITSENVRNAGLYLVWSASTDATSDRTYPIKGSVLEACGFMPPYYVPFFTHDSVAALNATAGNHALGFHRTQKQTV